MRRAIKESITDTLFGMAINIPINFLLLSLAFQYDLSVSETTVLLTVVFTVIAIIRKTAIRLHFSKND